MGERRPQSPRSWPARGGAPEWERINVGRRPEVLREAAVKAIKVGALWGPLPARCPALYSYRVIHMDHPIEEVVESQRQMMRRRGTPGGSN